MRHLFIILSLFSFTFCESFTDKQNKFKKHNLSIGVLDDRTGFSLISYTYNIKQTNINEFFIGGGTMLVALTGVVGWKHYYSKSKLAISSVLCVQYVTHMGFMGFLPAVSTTLEYNITNLTQLKVGAWGFSLLGGTSSESSGNSGVLPFIGLSFNF